ncbi:MAG: MBL fold metallo-hydrolase [Rhodobacteraceae bacterium]|nr:MBL fold metallo-hydrolase [Paracoccaceae bacterium]
MKLTRRTLIKGVGAGLALSASGAHTAFAANELEFGAMKLQTFSDGYLTLPGDFLFAPMPKKELVPILTRHGLTLGDPLHSVLNVTLLRDGDNLILFDTGSGPAFQQSAGELGAALEAAGIDPADVTHVIFTHAHPDHLWGVLDDFDDPYFYEAEHMMGRVEWDYWFNPETVNTVTEAQTSMAVGARRRMETIEDTMTLFDDGDEVLPGILARATHGHTPGHMSFELRSGSESVMVLGDAITSPHVGFERPGWEAGSDQDPTTAAAMRVRLLDQLAHENMTVVGYHLPGGGIGRAERNGDSYRFVSQSG